ncbi:MAG: hypothetical protein O2897_05515 [bacterium]|nr:hypothetical protein [bacterium]
MNSCTEQAQSKCGSNSAPGEIIACLKQNITNSTNDCMIAITNPQTEVLPAQE